MMGRGGQVGHVLDDELHCKHFNELYIKKNQMNNIANIGCL